MNDHANPLRIKELKELLSSCAKDDTKRILEENNCYLSVKDAGGAHLLSRFGHGLFEPHVFMLHKHFGKIPADANLILLQEHPVCSDALVELWSNYCVILQDHEIISKIVASSFERVFFPTFDFCPEYAFYESLGKKLPVVDIPESFKIKGKSLLENIGVKPDDWFVVMHAREAGYMPELYYHSYRDIGISSYTNAIIEVIKRKGWVVRIGDKTMQKLTTHPRIIDLPFRPDYEQWMDLYFLKNARFFLGTTSGPNSACHVFGVPGACANVIPFGIYATVQQNDRCIPKLLREKNSGRFLSFDEMLSDHKYEVKNDFIWDKVGRAMETIRNFTCTGYYDQLGLEVINNSPEDIKDLCVEMLENTEKFPQRNYDIQDEMLQLRIKGLLFRQETSITNGRIGRDFLRKHKDLFAE